MSSDRAKCQSLSQPFDEGDGGVDFDPRAVATHTRTNQHSRHLHKVRERWLDVDDPIRRTMTTENSPAGDSRVRIGFVEGPHPNYARNVTLRQALEADTYDVVRIPAKARCLLRARDVDLLFVSYPGYRSMPLAWAVARLRGLPVVFDAFLSLHETRVVDRQEVSRWGWRSLLYRILEMLACWAATVVVVDTAETGAFLARRTYRRKTAFVPVVVSSNVEVMKPCANTSPVSGAPIRVSFYGTFSPLQGPEVIVGAATILEREAPGRFSFILIGDGPLRAMMEHQVQQSSLDSVTFLPYLPIQELREELCAADIVLGVFGTSPKTQRVIPNKVFDALALGKPLVTARARALEAELRDREHAWFVTAGSPEELAEALRSLEADPTLAAEMAEKGHQLFTERMSHERVRGDLAAALARAGVPKTAGRAR